MNERLFSPRKIFPLLAAWLVLTIAVLSCSGETASAPPAPSATQFSPTQSADFAPTSQPAIPERRLLTVEFPPQIRAGDSDRVRLTLEVDAQGNLTPTAIVDGNVIEGEVIEIPNLYETHHVVVEAKFDIAGVEVSPPGLSSQTLGQGQTVTFFWSVRPAEVGVYRGTIWLYLRFRDKVSGEESQKTVTAQGVDIEALNLIGLPVNVARTLGVAGSVVGTLVGLPFFEDIVRYLFARRRQRGK